MWEDWSGRMDYWQFFLVFDESKQPSGTSRDGKKIKELKIKQKNSCENENDTQGKDIKATLK